jgi:hypothetical protein
MRTFLINQIFYLIFYESELVSIVRIWINNTDPQQRLVVRVKSEISFLCFTKSITRPHLTEYVLKGRPLFSSCSDFFLTFELGSVGTTARACSSGWKARAATGACSSR